MLHGGSHAGADRGDSATSPPTEAGARVRWRSPQVLLPALALLASSAYLLRSGPPAVPPPPDLRAAAGGEEVVELREVVVYRVDDQLARPVVREIADAQDPGLRTQRIVDEVRTVMVEAGAWPPELPAPRAFRLEVQREPVVVLDMPEHDARLDVALERGIVASLERTLLEEGVERIAYLRGGRAVDAWLGGLTVPSSLD